MTSTWAPKHDTILSVTDIRLHQAEQQLLSAYQLLQQLRACSEQIADLPIADQLGAIEIALRY